MFDVGFSEIVVIAVVALIVIGPERLPKVARTLGHLFGRMQRYVNDVKSDISREMELDELRKLQASVQDAAQAIEQSVKTEINATESQLNSIAASAADAVQPLTEPLAEPVVEPPAVAPVAEPAVAAAAPESNAQLELGLDATAQAARKQA
jgi:sec-independent protein translocase protein TatB